MFKRLAQLTACAALEVAREAIGKVFDVAIDALTGLHAALDPASRR